MSYFIWHFFGFADKITFRILTTNEWKSSIGFAILLFLGVLNANSADVIKHNKMTIFHIFIFRFVVLTICTQMTNCKFIIANYKYNLRSDGYG